MVWIWWRSGSAVFQSVGRRYCYSKRQSAALRNGMSIRKLFDQLTTVRETIHIPLVMIGSSEPHYAIWLEAFVPVQGRSGRYDYPDLPIAAASTNIKPLLSATDWNLLFLIYAETSEGHYPRNRRSYQRIYLHGVVGCNYRYANFIRLESRDIWTK